jgi:hypothetical protein
MTRKEIYIRLDRKNRIIRLEKEEFHNLKWNQLLALSSLILQGWELIIKRG